MFRRVLQATSFAVLLLHLVSSQDYKDAIFVGLKKSLDKSDHTVLFDHEEVDVRGSYDIRSGNFFATKAGVYWATVSNGAKPGLRSSLYLRRSANPQRFINAVDHHSNLHNGTDTNSCSMMLPVKYLDSVYVRSGWGPAYSDEGLQTSLGLFRLTDLMNSSVMFTAFRNTTFHANADSILPFEHVHVNEGNSFDKTNGVFVVPRDGFYFVSYCASFSTIPFELELRRNAALLSNIESYSQTATDSISQSRGSIYWLLKADNIFIIAKKQTEVFSNYNKFTCFSAFLYNPVHGVSYAWAVARTVNWDGPKKSPIPFDQINVNLGMAWDRFRNAFVCPVTGIYYITYSIGVKAWKPVYVSLMVNGMEKVSLTRQSTNHNGRGVMSRSAILHLQAGDIVYLEGFGNTAIYSDKEKQATFSGLLLFPHP